MGKRKPPRVFVADFETSVYEGQTKTEVWAAATVELGTENVVIHNSISKWFNYIGEIAEYDNVVVYFHNLKFDGNFILWHLMFKTNFKPAATEISEDVVKWDDTRTLANRTYSYSIGRQGQWYTMRLGMNDHQVEIRDSLKLLPFALRKIGKDFKTKHQKLDIEYEGERHENEQIKPEEKEYIRNDVLVIKEALEIMYSQGHNKLTIGACCMSEFKTILQNDYSEFRNLFPRMDEVTINSDVYGEPTADAYIRHAYKGGWCYLVKGKENKIFHNGTTADVNSLYPSVMSSESGSAYPYGNPKFWQGEIPAILTGITRKQYYYFIKIRTRFKIKPGYLPFIQIKGNPMYRGTESLETSDIILNGKHYDYYLQDGKKVPAFVTLTLTCTDWELMQEHYDLIDCTVLSGCYFKAHVGFFDDYIDKYRKIKETSKGAQRQIAKLFLNNLYGKMATSTDSSFKWAERRDDEVVHFRNITEREKEPVYIPIGAAITSYARNFTIRHAQMNFHGKDKPGFIYADTDSLHMDLPPEKIVGLKVHPTNFCAWKLESCWDSALFVRQKTYAEHITREDLEPIDNPHWDIKCAGLPENCKKLFLESVEQTGEDNPKWNEEEREYAHTKREITDFKVGLQVPGKLTPVHMPGGVVLERTMYELRPQ